MHARVSKRVHGCAGFDQNFYHNIFLDSELANNISTFQDQLDEDLKAMQHKLKRLTEDEPAKK